MLDSQTSDILAQLGYDAATIQAILSWSLYLTIVSVIAAIPTGMIARRKGRSVVGWVIFALLVPLLPLLIVWLLPAKPKQG